MVRSIKTLLHRETPGGWFWLAALDCGHAQRLGSLREITAPSPEPLGAVVNCERCDRIETALTRLWALHRAGKLAQVVRREDERFAVYAKDPTNPKGRAVLFLVEDCERVRAVLRKMDVCVFRFQHAEADAREQYGV